MSGAPRGKGRPRTRVVKAGPFRPAFATIYTDDKTRKYEASIREIAAAAMGAHAPFIGALSMSVRFRMECPKSMNKAERAAVLAGEMAYLGAFDLDNMLKAVADPLNGVVYEDDRQIVRCWIEKGGAEAPGIDVRIEALEPQE